MKPQRSATPYADAAMHYLPEWSPIPIRTVDGTKRPCVKGFSGYKGEWATEADVRGWCASPNLARAQLGIRLPRDVIGIDVDCYGDKLGERTFAALQNKWGRLAPTWISTSRVDGSGIRLYRLPSEVDAGAMREPRGHFEDGTAIGGLEIVRYCHRFVTAWPSRHGRENWRFQYLWFAPDLYTDPDNPVHPLPEDIPELGGGWCEGLLSESTSSWGNGEKHASLGGARPREWLKTRPRGDGPLCEAMESLVVSTVKEILERGEAGGCYPVTNVGLFRLVGNAAEGHSGAYLAALQLWKAYKYAMLGRAKDRRPLAQLETEFTNSIRGAIEALPARKFSDDDPCEWMA